MYHHPIFQFAFQKRAVYPFPSSLAVNFLKILTEWTGENSNFTPLRSGE